MITHCRSCRQQPSPEPVSHPGSRSNDESSLPDLPVENINVDDGVALPEPGAPGGSVVPNVDDAALHVADEDADPDVGVAGAFEASCEGGVWRVTVGLDSPCGVESFIDTLRDNQRVIYETFGWLSESGERQDMQQQGKNSGGD